MQCKMCNHETDNPKFCSRSCSSSFNNLRANGRKTGKKQKPVYCKSCDKLVITPRRKFCDSCTSSCIKTVTSKWVLSVKITKGEAITADTQKYRRIREYARLVAIKNKLLNQCSVCDYSLHVECCHKKPIASFPDDTLLSVINDPKNLTGMCRNHHWEFDNGFLTLN